MTSSLIATKLTELQELLNGITISDKKYGLEINKGTRKVKNAVTIVDGDILQQVDHFQYMGAVITEDGMTRLGMSQSVLTELEHIWKSRAITTCNTCTKLYAC